MGYGMGSARLDIDFVDAADLAERLKTLFRSPSYRPPILPTVAVQLYELSRKEDASIPVVVRLLETDPLLASSVLRRAQSPLYSARTPLRSIRDAVVRLGLRDLSNLVLETAMNMRVFRAPGYDEPMERLRMHSIATAHIAGLVAHRTSLYNEYAFLCGLVHDVGAAVAMIALCEGRKANEVPPFDTVLDAIQRAHVEAAGILAQAWKLPSDVTNAVSQHGIRRAAAAHPIIAILAIADGWATRLGYGFFDEADQDFEWAIDLLGIRSFLPAIERDLSRLSERLGTNIESPKA